MSRGFSVEGLIFGILRHRRTGNFLPGGGGRYSICQKNSSKLPKFLQNSRKESRAMQTNMINMARRLKNVCEFISDIASLGVEKSLAVAV